MIIGTIFALITQPGRGVTVTDLLTDEIGENVTYNFVDNVVSWVPTNIVQAMAEANMLQIIVFSLFIGIVLLNLGDRVAPLIKDIDFLIDRDVFNK